MLGKVGQAARKIAEPTNTQGVGSAIARAKKSGLSTEDQLAQDTFVQKFVTRGSNALNTAIQQGLVDVASTDLGAGPAKPQKRRKKQVPPTAPVAPAAGGQSAAPAAPAAGGQPGAAAAPSQTNVGGRPNPYMSAAANQPAPAAGAAPGAAPKVPPAQAYDKGPRYASPPARGDQAIATGQKQGVAKPEIDQHVDKIVSAMRKLQPAGTKPLPPESKMAKEIAADLGKVSLNKDYLLRVGDKILKANNAGYDVKDAHTQFMGQLAKGTKNKSIQEERMFELLVKLITEEKFRQKVYESGRHPSIVITRFKTLLENSTNEGILDKVKGFFGKKPAAGQPAPAPAAGQPAPAAGAAPAAGQPAAPSDVKPSLGAWFRDNFMKGFLRGINLGSSQKQVDDILKRMPQSLKAKTLNKDLTDIAQIAWAVSDQGRSKDK